MNKIAIICILTVACVQPSILLSQDGSTNTNGNQGQISAAGVGTPPTDGQPTPEPDNSFALTEKAPPILSEPTIQPVTVYRLAVDYGILSADGAEITLPDIPDPSVRYITARNGYLEVTDIAADGTETKSNWDISSLIEQYKPDDPNHTGYYNNNVTPAEERSGQANTSGATANTPTTEVETESASSAPVRPRLVVPDRLLREKLCTYTVDQPQGAEEGAESTEGTTVPLGSFFVDGNYKIVYTPPHARVFMRKPQNVERIHCTSHFDSDGRIAVEWSLTGEETYHLLLIDVSTKQVIKDVAEADEVGAQHALTWINNNTILGQFNMRVGDEITRFVVTKQSGVTY